MGGRNVLLEQASTGMEVYLHPLCERSSSKLRLPLGDRAKCYTIDSVPIRLPYLISFFSIKKTGRGPVVSRVAGAATTAPAL